MSNHALPVDESGQNQYGESSGAREFAGGGSSFREKAQQYLGGDRGRELADAAADRVNEAADYLRNTDAQRMKSDVESLVKSNPGPAMLVAGMVGFVIGRALIRR